MFYGFWEYVINSWCIEGQCKYAETCVSEVDVKKCCKKMKFGEFRLLFDHMIYILIFEKSGGIEKEFPVINMPKSISHYVEIEKRELVY